MARRASVRYWASRKAYCCWFRGQQHVLAEGPDDFPAGPTYQAALRQFSALTALSHADAAKDGNTTRVVCEMYLQWLASRRKPDTLKIRKRSLEAFTDSLGEVLVKDLTQHLVYKWLDTMRQWRVHPGNRRKIRWTDGSVRNACTTLQATFNWAARTGLITRNPLYGMEQPAARSRGRQALIGRTPEERKVNHQRILEAASKSFRPFIICLEATGARPSELAAATAADFDSTIGAIVYHADDKRLEHEHSHKTARKNKDRIIMLSGQALAVVRRLIEENPSGPLFQTGMKRLKHKDRGPSGWTIEEIGNRFRVIRETVAMPNLTAYSYRHTFATAWLEQGRSIEVLAELMGNSPAVIRQHYSHLLGNPTNLRNQLEAFNDASAAGTQTPLTVYHGETEPDQPRQVS